MNTKIRALLWEEFRVGGAIAGAILAVTALMQMTMRLEPTIAHRALAQGGELDSITVLGTLGFPLLLVLLLTLNTTNSGHLSGGFSRRILRLPVETSKAVLVILLTRVGLVLVVSAALNALTWALFGNGLKIQTFLMLGLVYLAIQTLDWLRGVAQALTVGIVALLGASVLSNQYQFSDLVQHMYLSPPSTAGLTAYFLLALAATYGVSLVTVHLTRCGYRMSFFDGVSLTRDKKRAGSKRPFASVYSAQLWYESRRTGWIFPAATALFWVGGLALRWLMLRDQGVNPAVLPRWRLTVLDPTWSCEIIPYLSLLGAVIVRNMLIGLRARRTGRPTDFLLRLPTAPMDMARADLTARGISLGGTLAVVATVATCGFLLQDGHAILHLYRDALAGGEMSLREVLAVLVGPVLLAFLVTWSAVGQVSKTASLCASSVFGGLVGLDVAGFLLGPPFLNLARALANVLILIALVAPIVYLVRGLLDYRRREVVSRWSMVSCLLIWMAIVAAVYPYTAIVGKVRPAVMLSLCAALAAYPVLPFLNSLRQYSRVRDGETTPAAPVRFGYTPRRLAVLVLLLSLLLGIAVIRSSIHPVYLDTWHARGWPTTMAELEATYPAVPDDKNLANLYVAAGAKWERLDRAWQRARTSRRMPQSAMPPSEDEEESFLTTTLGDEESPARRASLLSPKVRRAAQEYWERVGKDVAPDLHRAADSGLTASRYPLNLRRTYIDSLSHLAKLCWLAKVLAIETQVACAERRPDDACQAILDTFPIGESVRHEPFLISQTTRDTAQKMAVESLEDTMNSMALDEARLARLAAKFESVRPRTNEMSPYMNAEVCAKVLHEAFAADYANGEHVQDSLPEGSWGRFIDLALVPVWDALGQNSLNRTVVNRVLSYRWELGRRNATQRRELNVTYLDSPYLILRASSTYMRLSSHARDLVLEWRSQVRLDTARVAIAVERYRLANHRPPAGLAELVPQFLPEAPSDPFNDDAPLVYRVDADGSFVVYSVGNNRRDDGGESRTDAKKDVDDIAFRVARVEAEAAK